MASVEISSSSACDSSTTSQTVGGMDVLKSLLVTPGELRLSLAVALVIVIFVWENWWGGGGKLWITAFLKVFIIMLCSAHIFMCFTISFFFPTFRITEGVTASKLKPVLEKQICYFSGKRNAVTTTFTCNDVSYQHHK